MQSKLFIDGKWHDARNGGTLDVVNPANEKVFHRCAAGAAEDIDAAVAAAKAAMVGPWSRTTATTALRFSALSELRSKSGNRHSRKSRSRTTASRFPKRFGTSAMPLHCFNLYATYAEELDGRQGEIISIPDARFQSRVKYMSAGVAGLIVPWNYPLLMGSLEGRAPRSRRAVLSF